MINFIIEEEKLKEVIDNYMMNYNYTYDIKIYDSYKENNYFNIYILNYDSKNILDINKIKRIRYKLDDWSSIIILLIKNDKDKYSLFDKRFMILDIISTEKDFKERLKEDILISIKNLDKKNNILKFTYKGSIYNIPFQDILFIENDSENKRCLIKTNNNNYYIPLTLSKLIDNLDNRFIKCSRSYIINLEKVRIYNTKNNIIYFDDEISICEVSREKKKEIIAYLRGIR